MWKFWKEPAQSQSYQTSFDATALEQLIDDATADGFPWNHDDDIPPFAQEQ